jgi:putative glutamine amidotransferase
MKSLRSPVVLLPACHQPLDGQPTHTLGQEYTEAVRLSGGLALAVPEARADELDALLALADGVLLTGSPSNVHPSHFGEAVRDPSLPLDPERDAWTLPLIRRALTLGVPLLAICRGAQEVNVALGGSLHQAVHEVGPYADHRWRDEDPVHVQYRPVHEVVCDAGGYLAEIVGAERFMTNSLHGQGVNRLADGLHVEARAPDGLIEAFRAPAAPGFNLCLQWHPEWNAARDPVSLQIFNAFGAACRERRDGPRSLGQARA